MSSAISAAWSQKDAPGARSISVSALRDDQGGRAAFAADKFQRSASSYDAVISSPIATAADIEERLFNERAQFKIAVSKISMHLEKTWPNTMFGQIDQLYSLEDWDEESTSLNGASFQTFLRFVVFADPRVLPGLAIAANHNPVASWVEGSRRVHIEFQERDLANAMLAKNTERGPEAASWRGPVTNIRTFIEAFGNAGCLGWHGKAEETPESTTR